jgi:hypothetical protein
VLCVVCVVCVCVGGCVCWWVRARVHVCACMCAGVRVCVGVKADKRAAAEAAGRKGCDTAQVLHLLQPPCTSAQAHPHRCVACPRPLPPPPHARRTLCSSCRSLPPPVAAGDAVAAAVHLAPHQQRGRSCARRHVVMATLLRVRSTAGSATGCARACTCCPRRARAALT